MSSIGLLKGRERQTEKKRCFLSDCRMTTEEYNAFLELHGPRKPRVFRSLRWWKNVTAEADETQSRRDVLELDAQPRRRDA